MYIIINRGNNEVYYYSNHIEMGFALDRITDELDRLDIDYEVVIYNNGKVRSIRLIPKKAKAKIIGKCSDTDTLVICNVGDFEQRENCEFIPLFVSKNVYSKFFLENHEDKIIEFVDRLGIKSYELWGSKEGKYIDILFNNDTNMNKWEIIGIWKSILEKLWYNLIETREIKWK